jgi:hypothetical protein
MNIYIYNLISKNLHGHEYSTSLINDIFIIGISKRNTFGVKKYVNRYVKVIN